VLAQPAQSLTDLALALVTLALAMELRRTPSLHTYWRAAFWFFGLAALAGAVHHGVVVRWSEPAKVSWALISVIVVVAVSYLLAGTVAEVLAPDRTRVFWLLRSLGLFAYIGMAASGRAGIAAILLCESLTMISVLALWVWAAYRRNPLAGPVLLAIAASIAAASTKALSPALVGEIGLDPTSACHLAQIVGTVLLYVAVSRPQRQLLGRSEAPAAPAPTAG
jgi:hypothetical protein